MHAADPYAAGRDAMLRLLRRGVRDERVLAAMAAVGREEFVPPHLRTCAYDDRALPIGDGQTISQPLIVALMLQALELRSGDRVLEVGTGSGYQAALLSLLARDVVTVERVEALLDRAREVLTRLRCGNVRAHVAGDVLGWPESAPYDAIVVAAAAPHVPRALVDQLAPGGRLVLPVGTRREQQLVRVRKTPHGVALDRLGACAFVPLISPDAWHDDADGAPASRRTSVR
ncbi:MAG: protein-L-isoaspartate(D-aspartate) O-methyltransferase [Dehalococcoidia bacterium]